MLKKIKSFFLTAILGGLTVILPIAIIMMVIKWLVTKITFIISPITGYLTSNSNIQGFVANLFVLAVLIGLCFAVGLVERTRLGKFIVASLDKYLLKKLPGYSLVKDTISQLLGKNKAPFSQVALVNIFGNDVRCTGFITETHPDGSYTVFVPMGPNPTSGHVCHMPKEFVELIDTSAEEAMKTVIGCGVGAQEVLKESKR